MEKLALALEIALRNIASNGKLAMPKADINMLIELGYITPKFGGGWMVNSKGREYLKQHK